MDIGELIIQMSAPPGPAGFETCAAEIAESLLKPYMDEVWTDVLGNVIGVRRCGRENAPKLLLDAHVDEIGLIVTGVEDGFLRFSTLGGVDARVLPTAEVKILCDPPVMGVVAAMPPHVLKKDEMEKAVKLDSLFIDVGLSKEEAEKKIPLGTPAVFNTTAQKLGENMICGRALDDRAGFAAIIRALELLGDAKLGVDLYVMASAQEEVGTRGAKTGAFSIDPDYSIVVDVGHAQTPDLKSGDGLVSGGGVAIAVGPNMNRAFTEKLIKAAREHEIKSQIEVIASGDSGTNTRSIQISREGVATALLSIPLKYMHTPVEVISLSDAEDTARLICGAVKSMEIGVAE